MSPFFHPHPSVLTVSNKCLLFACSWSICQMETFVSTDMHVPAFVGVCCQGYEWSVDTGMDWSVECGCPHPKTPTPMQDRPIIVTDGGLEHIFLWQNFVVVVFLIFFCLISSSFKCLSPVHYYPSKVSWLAVTHSIIKHLFLFTVQVKNLKVAWSHSEQYFWNLRGTDRPVSIAICKIFGYMAFSNYGMNRLGRKID